MYKHLYEYDIYDAKTRVVIDYGKTNMRFPTMLIEGEPCYILDENKRPMFQPQYKFMWFYKKQSIIKEKNPIPSNGGLPPCFKGTKKYDLVLVGMNSVAKIASNVLTKEIALELCDNYIKRSEDVSNGEVSYVPW